ncbi:sulfurtransferase [Roseateles microcysteis]|uniref:sulfurtransferase n=1 Tax=Roseateles microcysteis TaxID=3119057 RepID=UPI002FE53E57
MTLSKTLPASVMRRGLFKLAVSVGVLCGAGLSWAGVTLPGPVVDSAWLAANLDKVQVFEVRANVKSFTGAPEFETDAKSGKKTLVEVGGHIPGSRLMDTKPLRVDRKIGELTVKYMIPEGPAFEKVMQAMGVDADKPIVLVPLGLDMTDLDDALRAHWQLKVYGEDNMAVLDGGMANWLLEGRAHSSEAATARQGSWKVKADRSAQYMADSQAVADAVAAKSGSVVDGRDLRSFHGLAKRDYVHAAGHIPGAKVLPPELLNRPVAGGAVKLQSTATYRALVAALGIDADKPAIAYCNSGHLASGPWFVMSELLGMRNARLYDGSMHQWTLEKRPVEGAIPLQ